MKMSILESKPNPESSTTNTLHTLAIASSLDQATEHIGGVDGCFYELDHSKLPPELLNSTRIFMVSEKDLSKVSVRFPSLHSLKAFLSENASLKNQLPVMDERCYFEPETASEVLFRREEILERRLIKRRRFESLVRSLVKKKSRIVKAYVRYKLVEDNMLKVLKTRGGNAGRPIKRTEAWKLIGGAGLLKHMAGNKEAPGGAGQCRNADGAMEYWLESAADLVKIRKENGTQDLNCSTLPKELKKKEMESKQLEQGLTVVTTTSNTLVTSMDWDQACSSVIQLKEKYTQLAVRNSKFEEQMQQASQTLSGMEEEIKELKSTIEATGAELMYYSEAADVPQLTETKLETERGVIEAKETKVERIRSDFRFCRPQGTFRWPNMNISMSQHQIDPLAVSSTPSTAIQLDLVLPRSLHGLNEILSSGSLANTSTLLCNATNPPSHSPAFSQVPSENKDTNNCFSPTNLCEALVNRYDDMRNLKGTTAIARIGQDYIHLASDQRTVLRTKRLCTE